MIFIISLAQKINVQLYIHDHC
jgi:Mn-dependent DtxR family transcriptional regulator